MSETLQKRILYPKDASKNDKLETDHSTAVSKRSVICVLLLALSIYTLQPVFTKWYRQEGRKVDYASVSDASCLSTCSLRIAESIPTGLVLGEPNLSTYNAWKEIIEHAKEDIVIAAYKSSLQGKHVLGNELSKKFAFEGNSIYGLLLERGSNVSISMVENYPPKDKGDNEDALLLQSAGAVKRRYLTVSKIMTRGKMHSKFLLSDNKNFYLGSANLDWRSLNQKMELGAFVEDCPCLGEDLRRIYDAYWSLSKGRPVADIKKTKALYNMQHPLTMNVEGAKSEVYIASAPPELNNEGRTQDLHAILHTINSAQKFLYLHVMDYFPLFVYRSPQQPWTELDDALRRAILRGVDVKIMTAALHYPRQITSFLRSLQALQGSTINTSIQAKVLKVPVPEGSTTVVNRERRTHKKLLVTESTVVIGNSNWSGDYFEGGTTGTAIIIQQKQEAKPLVHQMKHNFERDFNSPYAHPVDEYFHNCIEERVADYCESTKDPSLFASSSKQ